VALGLVALAACGARHGPAPANGDGPSVYPLLSPPSPQPSNNWPLPPLTAEQVMRSCVLRAQHEWPAGGGVTGAMKIALYSPVLGKQFLAKWKPVPTHLDSWNNSPRRELAVYEVQKLFLDPADFVVPTSVMRCAPLDEYRLVIDGSAEPTVDGSRCVLGNLSLWLQDVRVDKPLYDEARFASDPNYAARMADFNLLTFLVAHKDGRSSNFLVAKNDSDRRVFAIDNGISFDAWIWNYFVPNWNELRVPALRRQSVDRLREARPQDIERLAVVAQLELEPDGMLESVEPTDPLGTFRGAYARGGVVQFGLTASEIDDLQERIAEVIERVDAGEVPVF